MKLVEIAHKYLTARQRQAWYQRRIENIEPEEVARRMGILVHSVHNLVSEADQRLADHVCEIEDNDFLLAYLIPIRRGHKVENAEDTTVKSVLYRQKRAFFVNPT